MKSYQSILPELSIKTLKLKLKYSIMFKVINRYLGSSIIPPFLIGFIFFIAFITTFYLFRLIRLFVYKGVDLNTIFMIVVELGVSFFPMAAPLAAFFATSYVLNKLSEDSEIIAMGSFGLSKFKIYTPFLMFSLCVALTITSLYSVFIPKANSAFSNNIASLSSAEMFEAIKPGQFFTDIPNVMLFAQEVTDNGSNFNKIFLFVQDKNTNERQIIFSNNGSLIRVYNGPVFSLRLHLTSGNIVKLDESGNRIEKMLFNEYDFPVFSSQNAIIKLPYDTMKTNEELKTIIAEKDKAYHDALLANKDPHDIHERKLTWYRTKSELVSRYAIFIQIILFVFLAFSLGIKSARSSNRYNSAQAFIIIICFYVVYYTALSFAHMAKIDPYIALFSPSLIFLIFTFHFYKKLDWMD